MNSQIIFFKFFNIKVLQSIILGTLLSLFMTACSQSENADEQDSQTIPSEGILDNPPEIPADEILLQGRVVKGVISNAIIKAYPIVDQNGIYAINWQATPITSRTGSNGYYQIKPGKGRNDQYYYLEVVIDEQSRMMCDFYSGCESVTGSHVNFGEVFSLSSSFTLSNIVKSKAGKISHAPISPLTHLAVQYMLGLPERFSPSNISIAEDFIKTKFGLGDRALSLLPSDLTALNEVKKLKEQELRLGILSAAFMPMLEQPNWDDLESLSMKALFLNAFNLAQFLGTQVESIQHLKALSIIESETYEQYQKQSEQALLIISQPESIEVEEGSDAFLSVEATSAKAINYQWLKNDVEIVGENSATLTMLNISISDSAVYTVNVVSDGEALTSLAALVSVIPKAQPLTIISQPLSIIVREGDQSYIEVIAQGAGDLAYQWQKGGSIIPNETAYRLSFNSIVLSDEGTYSVTVSNDISVLQSDFADITVNENIAAIEIVEQPVNVEIVEGGTANFSVKALGGGYIAYQWRKNSIAIINAYDASYSIEAASISDAGQFDVILTNSAGSVVSSIASLSIIPDISPVIIDQQPQAQITLEGETTLLTVFASGGGLLRYEWLKDNAPIANADKATLTISSSQLSDQGEYQVIVSNEVSSISSNSVFVTVTSAPSPEPIEVILSWVKPEFREDDSSLDLSDIYGYLIAYGAEPTDLSTQIKVVGGEVLSASILLTSGSYYFRIATVDINQNIGAFSNSIQLTLSH